MAKIVLKRSPVSYLASRGSPMLKPYVLPVKIFEKSKIKGNLWNITILVTSSPNQWRHQVKSKIWNRHCKAQGEELLNLKWLVRYPLNLEKLKKVWDISAKATQLITCSAAPIRRQRCHDWKSKFVSSWDHPYRHHGKRWWTCYELCLIATQVLKRFSSCCSADTEA